MKIIALVLSLLLLSVVSSAQPANGSDSNGTKAAAATKPGAVVIPPEKLRPINIPKLGTPIVIDGRPDEPARSARVQELSRLLETVDERTAELAFKLVKLLVEESQGTKSGRD